jgi:hypothetical protein
MLEGIAPENPGNIKIKMRLIEPKLISQRRFAREKIVVKKPENIAEILDFQFCNDRSDDFTSLQAPHLPELDFAFNTHTL